jgi:F-type H+-transporting ATPase subunit b
VISINIYEIAMQMVNFMILLFLLNKFAIKPLSQFLESRAATIKEDIETAESNKVDSEKLLEEQKELFQKAREEAKEIRLNAEESSKVEREQIITEAKAEAKRILDDARKQIDQSIAGAKKDLLSETGELAVMLSKQILKREVNAKDQEALVSETLGQLERV